MASRKRTANERFHDRYAGVYESRYTSAYWDIYDAVTWEHMRRFLPSDLSARVLDAGCGAGKWGLKLAKSGFRVTLSDLSQKMLDQAAKKAERLGLLDRVEFHKGDLEELEGLPDAAFGFATAQGDPLSLVERPARALNALARVCAPGAVVVLSVDNRWAGIDHYMARGDLNELERFLKTGRTEWLADRKQDRFPMHMFWPDELRQSLERHGFEVLDMLGKTVFARRDADLSAFEAPRLRARLVQLELRYGRRPEALGRAAHIQVAARRVGE